MMEHDVSEISGLKGHSKGRADGTVVVVMVVVQDFALPKDQNFPPRLSKNRCVCVELLLTRNFARSQVPPTAKTRKKKGAGVTLRWKAENGPLK